MNRITYIKYRYLKPLTVCKQMIKFDRIISVSNIWNDLIASKQMNNNK